ITRFAPGYRAKYFLFEFDHIFRDELPDIGRALRVHAVSKNDIYANVIPILGLEWNIIGAVHAALPGGGGHFDDLKTSVEGFPLVEHRQEEVGGARLVHLVFHTALSEERPLDGADAHFGRACD